MKLWINVLLLFTAGQSFADCDFVIINRTKYTVSAKVGLNSSQASIESSVIVMPNTISNTKIKSNYNCMATNILGMGMAFIHFPNSHSGAGASYSPEKDKGTITILGKMTGDKSGVPMVADNGAPLWLSQTNRPINTEVFEVKLNYVARPNRFSAGTD